MIAATAGLRSALVLGEIALAVVLLIGAALLIRTSIALGSVEPGFSADNVLLMRTSLSGTRYASAASVEQAVRSGRERLLVDSRSRRGGRRTLRADALRIGLAVQHHRPRASARRHVGSRRLRRRDAGLFRHVSNSAAARPRLQRRGYRRRAGCRHREPERSRAASGRTATRSARAFRSAAGE